MLSKTLFVIVIGLSLLACNRSSVLPRTGVSETMQGVSETPVIRFSKTDRGVIEVAGLDPTSLAKLRQAGLPVDNWEALYRIYPSSTRGADAPAMLGSYDVQGGAIRFTPRFPLVAGLTYKARFDLASFHQQFGTAGPFSAQSVIEVDLALPKKTADSNTIVSHIYPSASELPANQLKLYLHFSSPMSVGEAYERLHLVDEKGREMPRAFLIIDQELWDPSRRRFTLLFDPGRVKRGLRSNLEDGAPLKEGKRYCLVIDHDWRDGNGNPLGEDFKKWFTVIAADRKAPDCKAWKITAPAANTLEPLKLVFDEALDRALLEEMIEIRDANGNQIAGRVEIADGETQWFFIPTARWRSGDYSLRVDEKIEDRAGNNLGRLFDADVTRHPATQHTESYVDLRFSVIDLNR